MNKTIQYRQGDVLLEKVPPLSPSNDFVFIKPDKRGFVLAHGEATGHAHLVDPSMASLFRIGPMLYIDVFRPCCLTHEEHAAIELEEGTYLVRRQYEYTPEEIQIKMVED